MEARVTLAINKTVKQEKRIDLTDPDESEFWQAVSEVLLEAPIPCTMNVEYGGASAILEVGERGTYFDNGIEFPSMFVTPLENNISLPPATYEERYLTCINPETKGGQGSYKFYRLRPTSSGFEAEYGRIGGPRKGNPPAYPSWMFWIRYHEKLSKGYKDQSDVYLDQKGGRDAEDATGETVVPDSVDGSLYALLLGFARGRVRNTLLAGENFTDGMARRSRELLDTLKTIDDVDEFNGCVLDLMQVAPRHSSCVKRNLASTADDFARIIGSEESIVMAMEAIVGARNGKALEKSSFASFGIGIRLATGEEIEADVNPNLSDRLRGQMKSVWVVDPEAQRLRFEERCNRRHIGPGGRRLLWHGSRNENWCSIVQKSLMLNPDAVRTGSMFGNGLYFSLEGHAGRGEKSWGYTSARGSYWANGRQDVAFMALFECAYGTPKKVKNTGWYSQADMDRSGCDCLHAEAAPGFLMNDEIVFYREDAVCMRYLVEFAA